MARPAVKTAMGFLLRAALLAAAAAFLALLAASGASTAAPVNLTINVTAPGAEVLVNGTALSGSSNITCDYAAPVAVEAPSPQVNNSTRYVFESWSDGGAQNHSASCVEPFLLEAVFAAEYLTVIDTLPSRTPCARG